MAAARILVVEDDPHVGHGLVAKLEARGYTVIGRAETGEQAISMAERLDPDLVLMDVVLPGDLDGIEAARAIRARREIPVVYVSAFSDEEKLVAAGATEAYGYLIKPCSSLQLHAAITMALRKDQVEHRLAAAERRLMETALRTSEQRFQAVIDHTFQFIALLEADGTLVEANRAVLEFAGLRREQVVGRRLWDTPWWSLSEEARARLRNAVARAGAGEFVRYETDIEGAGGRVITVDFSLKPVRDENGAVVMLIPEGRDITELKAARLTLERSERALRALHLITIDVDATTEEKIHALLTLGTTQFGLGAGVLTHADDDSFRIVAAVDGGLDVAAGQRCALDDSYVREILSADEPVAAPRLADTALAGRGAHRRLGVESLFAMPVRVDGRPWGTLEFMDRSPHGDFSATDREILKLMARWVGGEQERRQVAEEREVLLRELTIRNTEMENFVYTISHDLKSPLITIGGFAGALAHDLERGDADKAQESIGEIRSAVTTMHDLIEELLDLSRSGRLTGELRAVALDDLIGDVIARLRDRIETERAQITAAAGFPVIRADRSRLAQVLFNLFDNALKYRRPEVELSVEVGWQCADGELRVFVRDNGRGIRPEYQKRVFELFQRADTSTEGTGVGLAIARRIVEAHGGSMWVESEPGRGSSFWISLPDSVIVNRGSDRSDA